MSYLVKKEEKKFTSYVIIQTKFSTGYFANTNVISLLPTMNKRFLITGNIVVLKLLHLLHHIAFLIYYISLICRYVDVNPIGPTLTADVFGSLYSMITL